MRLALLPVPALAVALTACGGGHRAPPSPPTAACSVHVYFATRATRAQEESVRSKLQQDARVYRVTYISRAQALAKMKKKFPALFGKGSPVQSNPLPDSFVVVPLDPSQTSALGHSFAGAKWPGVQNVVSRARAAACG